MSSFTIVTDSAADLTAEQVQQYGVEVVPLEEVRKVRAEMRRTERTGVCWWRNVQK